MNKVLIETTRKVISFEDSLNVLTYLGLSNPPHHNRKDSLPSWVVDWTVKSDPSRDVGARTRTKDLYVVLSKQRNIMLHSCNLLIRKTPKR